MSETSPTFSVIVPVYNVEEYVAECLDSALAQTYRDFEILVIDDGSTDGSSAIIERYAAKDARIRIIRQQNRGLSCARNVGVASAKGHYCLFLDSDDVIHPQLLEICHHFLRKHQADLISFNYANIAPHAGLPAKKYNIATLRYHHTHSPLPLLAQRHRRRIPLMTQNTCYRTELAQGTPFIEGILYEDYPHTTCLMRNVRTAISLQQKLYGYTSRPGSIMNSRFTVKSIDHYRRGLLSIAETYKDAPGKHSIVTRIIYPEILKQIGNAIFRAKCGTEELVNMLRAFRSLLLELHDRGILRWRGHKLRRYLAYRRLICTDEAAIGTIVAKLHKVFH